MNEGNCVKNMSPYTIDDELECKSRYTVMKIENMYNTQCIYFTNKSVLLIHVISTILIL